jgi:hypothetical protein
VLAGLRWTKWYGFKAKADEKWKASDDYIQALSCALELNDGNRERADLLILWLLRRAENLVEKNWPKIRLVAAALVERDRRSGNEIRHIVRGAGSDQTSSSRITANSFGSGFARCSEAVIPLFVKASRIL